MEALKSLVSFLPPQPHLHLRSSTWDYISLTFHTQAFKYMKVIIQLPGGFPFPCKIIPSCFRCSPNHGPTSNHCFSNCSEHRNHPENLICKLQLRRSGWPETCTSYKFPWGIRMLPIHRPHLEQEPQGTDCAI